MNLPGVYESFLDRWKNLQTCWVISDTHFGDEDLHQGIHNRPSDEEIIKIINSKCGRSDLLIHLGDVGKIECVKKLRGGLKILIMGNHDSGSSNYQRQIWEKKFDKEIYQKDEALMEMKRLYPDCIYTIDEGYAFNRPFEYWLVKADNKLFDYVFPGALIIGEKLMLSHEPIKQDWALDLHGHDHNHKETDIYHKNVCVDVFGPAPLNLNQFMKNGPTAKIESVHRKTIDTATKRKQKRGGKKVWEK